MTLRPATEADRAAVVALHAASWASAYRADLPDWLTEADIADFLTERWMPRRIGGDARVLLAERGGDLLGFVCVLPGETPPLLDNLHVAPAARGGGIGAALLHAMLDALARDGAAQVSLKVLESNPRARAFYLRHGGRDEGLQADALMGRPVRAHRIVFDLRP